MVDPSPLDLPARLEADLDGFGEGPYADLRVDGAAWIRSGGVGAHALGEALEAIAPLLTRSFLLGQPNVAGMGVGAWDLAVSSPAEAILDRSRARARRMLGRSGLAHLLEEEAEPPAEDPAALGRAADLVEAIQRLDAAAADIPEGAPDRIRDQAAALRRALSGRLEAEERHDRGVRRAIARGDLRDPDLPGLLRGAPRGQAPAPPTRLPTPAGYPAAIEASLALEARRPAEPEPADLAELRGRIAAATQAALAAPADSDRGRRLTERARRLMAEEVHRTDGRPARAGQVDTLSLRRALADRPTGTARPARGDLAPRAGLPEVPILSSRGPKARVIGYLRADERISGEVRGDHVRVSAPGRAGPAWIPAEMLGEAPLEARGPQLDAPLDYADAPPASAPPPGLARLAALVARHTGERAETLLAKALDDPEFARSLPAKAARRDHGAAGVAPVRGPVRIERVQVDGLAGPGGVQAAKAIERALDRLPEVLERRLSDEATRARMSGQAGGVQLAVTVDAGADPRAQGDALAHRIADDLIARGAATIGTLTLGVTARTAADPAPVRSLLARLAGDDVEGVAHTLAAERKTLDATLRGRLARFFGEEFEDVLVFAGPMAGALARSLEAEAVTHGRMVFFDPTHYRPDTPKGEALVAHELAHTRQVDDRDVRVKEAEALATEASYLDWIRPGGAPLARDLPLDPTAPAAAAAADVAGRAMRAAAGRHHESTAGPRRDRAQQEQRVEQILERVRAMMDGDMDLEGQRVGALRRLFVE